MNNYRDFSQVRTPQLWMQRRSWWKPWYELTDGQFSYGKLRYDGLMMRTASLETRNNSWLAVNKNIWSFNQVITDTDNKPLADVTQKLFKSFFELNFVDGTSYLLKQTSVWKGTYQWLDTNNTQVASVNQHAFSAKSMRFVVEQQFLTHKDLPLLLLLGTHLIFQSQRRSAATV